MQGFILENRTSSLLADAKLPASRCFKECRTAAKVARHGSYGVSHAEWTDRRRILLSATALWPLLRRVPCADAAVGDVTFQESVTGPVGRFQAEIDAHSNRLDAELEGGWRLFESQQFLLEVPPGYEFVDSPPPDLRSLGRGQAPPQSAVKAKFAQEGGDPVVSVVEYPAASIKPTFFQLTDVAQLGSVEEVTKLIVPPGSQVLAREAAKKAVPPRDTGTIRGVVQLPPQTAYRYEYMAGNGLHVLSSAVAQGGKVFIAGGLVQSGAWAEAGEDIRRTMGSFQLKPPR